MSRRTRARQAARPSGQRPLDAAPAEPLDTGPRKLARGPKITLTCDCGESRLMRYGERWRCEKCGRSWDTHKIPAAEYAAMKRLQHRFVLVPITVFTIILASVVLFAVFGRVYVFLLLPLGLTIWRTFGRNVHRRRLHEAVERQAPWKITPD